MAQRIHYMDWLRVISIFVVVGIHVVSKIINSGSYTEWEWQYANAIDSALRWCVPVFFMLSGALLLTRRPDEPVGEFLKKRLAKALIPLVFWSGVYTAYNIFEKGESYTIWEMIKLFLSDDVYYHLWFLYVIIGLYVMAPFLRILVHHLSQKAFLYFLIFWFVYSGVLPFAPKFFGFELAIPAGMFEPYIGYFMLGAYLYLYPLSKKSLPLLGFLAIIGYFITFFGTSLLTERRGEFDDFFYEHYRPNALAITLFIYVGFQHLAAKIKPNRWITRMSTATLGIYVIHPLIQTYLHKIFGINEMTGTPIIGIPLVWILIFFLSFAIILLFQKIPGVKHIVP
ncbi:acyltransferase family protein [Planococcus shenhongbingii]|uniref:acyltransferase n=1 Tax=Planococcus shenhongbingii TaxID=3058398 RepID=UPI00262981C0|nr:acyltransferase family protein [Planococcus sp. N016]WKA57832.1 acyltransferase family protein [Planococcus sp. N016]